MGDRDSSSPDTSGDETDRSSLASDYHYIRQVEEKKKWDKFVSNEAEAGSASEKHTDLIKKASIFLKLLTTFICFSVVLVAGSVAKGSLLFMIAQVRNESSRYGADVIFCNPELPVRHGEPETVAWLW